MATYRNGQSFFEIPHATAYLLITANIVVYGLCLRQSGVAAIPGELLFRSGAMYSLALARHEYWRLLAYGFLHVNLIHLATNMLCLALWGGHLERRVGSLYFLVIYVSALIFGGVVSNFTHSGPSLAVGASGATSGVLGALLCLWILGKVNLSANFFVINIGLNIALAFSVSRIDWGAHLGGFIAGLIACAVLDLIEKVNHFVLRCKFPEFVKVNIFLAGAGLGLLLSSNLPLDLAFGREVWPPVLGYAVACCLVIKSIDLVLSLKHGIAIVAVILSAANAGLVVFAGIHASRALIASCASPPPEAAVLFNAACSNLNLTTGIVAACSFALTILLYSQQLHRGIGDVGFVGASLRAERKRRQGI